MPARRKVATFWLSELVCVVEPVGLIFLHSAVDAQLSYVHFPTSFVESLWPPNEPSLRVRAGSLSETLLFDLTGTGLPTESRDYTVSVEHKQTVG